METREYDFRGGILRVLGDAPVPAGAVLRAPRNMSRDALWGRLTDTTLAVVVRVDGPDRRRTR